MIKWKYHGVLGVTVSAVFLRVPWADVSLVLNKDKSALYF